MSETDEIGQALSGKLTTAVTGTAYAAQAVLQRQRQATLERARRLQQEAREATERLEAERQAARAALAVVDQPGWFEAAVPEQVVDVADLAAAWAPVDDTAARQERAIEERVRERWGTTVDELRARTGRGAAAGERAAAGLDVGDATALAAAADALEAREARDEHERESNLDEAGADRDLAAAAWDSAERRQDLAATLESIDNSAAVNARIVSDRDQGTPPRAAVAKAPSAAKGRAKARTAPSVQRTSERAR